MSYTVCIYNGNTGRETTYDTIDEAKRDADSVWTHLTPKEKIKYTNRTAGACFCITENDENDIAVGTAYDYADEMEEE